MKLTPAILDALGSANPDGNLLYLHGRLTSKLYRDVDAVLQTAGGRWDKHLKAHVFPGDAWQAVMNLTAREEVTTAREAKQADGWFATPADVVEELLQLADPQPWMRALEPSAGEGAIAIPLAERVKHVDAFEIDPERAGRLGRAARHIGGLHADFLRHQPGYAGAGRSYDLIVMNPPFANGADVRHVTHALRFLSPAGRLVAVMSAGVQDRGDKATRTFRALVEERRGWFTELDPGAFAESGTDIKTVIVTIHGAEAAKSRPVCPFRVEVAGRTFEIAPLPESFRSCDDDWTPVDCRDVATRLDAQAIVLTATATDPARLVEDPQIRSAIRTADSAARKRDLPDDFIVTPCDPGLFTQAPAPAQAPVPLPTSGAAQLDLFGEVA